MDPTVNPCENFYEYACGNFAKYHSEDSFEQRRAELEKELDEAVNDAANKSNSHAVQYVTQLYQECNNTELLDSIGTKPLLKVIDSVVGGWPILRQKKANNETTKHWPTLYEQMFAKLGISPIFLFKIQYLSFSSRREIMILPGTTGIGFELLNEPEKYEKAIQAYRTYLRNVTIMLGAPDDQQLTKDIDAILALETKLANLRKGMQDIIQFKTFDTLNNLSLNQIDWLQTLNYIVNETHSKVPQFKSNNKIGTGNATFFEKATKILEETTIQTLQNLFGWMVALKYGPLTTNKYREIEHQYQSVITGTNLQVSHWKACFRFANSMMPYAVSRVYVDSHFLLENRNEATIMVKEIKASFNKILEQNTWLDSETEKLAAIRENVGYADWIVTDKLDKYYYALKDHKVIKNKFFESAVELAPVLLRNALDSVSKPINHTQLWPITPLTVNAVYRPTENSITIPVAILQPPFFNKNRPFAINYGSIGMLIGHEMTHGFDNLRIRYDKDGKEKNWWSNKTLAKFNKLSDCFVKQYGSIHVKEVNLNVNGSNTLGENIADNGGVKEGFYAYRNHQAKRGNSQTLPGLKLNSDQLFFLGYANTWCNVDTPQMLRQLILGGFHTPKRYRVNVPLRNFPEFAKTFQCAAGTKMNLANKCAVW